MTYIIETFKTFTPIMWIFIVTATFFCYYVLNRFYRWWYEPEKLCYTVLCSIFMILTTIGTLTLIIWKICTDKTIDILSIVFVIFCFIRSYLELSYWYEITNRTFIDDDINVDDIITITFEKGTIEFRLLGKVRLEDKLYYVMAKEADLQNSDEDNIVHADIYQMSFDSNYVCIDAVLITNTDEINKVFSQYVKELN